MAIFLAFGNAVASVSTPLFASHIFGTNNYGVMMGITNSAFQVGMALGGISAAAVYDIFGSYKWAWIGLTVVALLSMTCISLSYTISRKKYSRDVKCKKRSIKNDTGTVLVSPHARTLPFY